MGMEENAPDLDRRRAFAAGALAASGADVAALDVAADLEGHAVPMATPQDLAETVRLVERQGRRAVAVRADVRDLPALERAVTRTLSNLGRLDVVAANAGIHQAVGFLSKDADAWRRSWELQTAVNLLGTANTLRAALPAMARAGRGGRVVVTSSTFGRQGSGANPAYVASKWALVGLTKAAAIGAGPSGVVNAIAPTGVVAGLGGPQSPEQRARGERSFRSSYHALPVGALQPEDVAGTVVYLASPAARYVTGQVVDVAAGANARYTA